MKKNRGKKKKREGGERGDRSLLPFLQQILRKKFELGGQAEGRRGGVLDFLLENFPDKFEA